MLDAERIFEASAKRAMEKVAGVFIDQISDAIANCILSSEGNTPDFSTVVPAIEKLSSFCVKNGGEALVEDFDPLNTLQRSFSKDISSATDNDTTDAQPEGDDVDGLEDEVAVEAVATDTPSDTPMDDAATGEESKIAAEKPELPIVALLKGAVAKKKKLAPSSVKSGKDQSSETKSEIGGRLRAVANKLKKEKNGTHKTAAIGEDKPGDKKDRIRTILHKYI